jgi:Helix-turn-helix domain
MPRKNSASEPPGETSNVIPLRPSKAAKLRSEQKWGVDVMAIGFTILPSLLFRAQNRLGLKSTHFAIILQLSDYWWFDDNLPFPKKQTIGERIGLKEKQVQRLIRDLEQRGYVKRIVRKTPHGQSSNFYDLSGLVKRLKELEPEFREAAAAKRKVERRGGLKAKTA